MTEIPARLQRFTVIDVIGAGGMGTVLRAHDPQLDREVAIKLLTGQGPMPAGLSLETTLDLRGDEPAAADALLHEARMLARLSHPNVIAVYEAGLANGAVFLVMELVDGIDLERWLAEPRSTAEIRGALADAARGLAAAHDRDIVHGDFKPANVLVGRDGRIRVADFGLARLAARTNALVTTAGTGTPHYMAPELWRGDPPTRASDVFAFCVAAIEALEPHGDVPLELTRGISEKPSERPSMALVIVALVGAPGSSPRNRLRGIRMVAIAAACAGGIAAAAVVVRARSKAASCIPPTLPGRFDEARRHELERALAPIAKTAPGIVERAVVSLTAQEEAIDAELATTCEAARAGTILDAEVPIRISCLERRHLELASSIDLLISTSNPAAASDTQLAVSAAECRELTAPPLPPADARGPVTALYRRWEAVKRLTLDAALPEYVVLEAAATDLGERELAARAARKRGNAFREADKLAEADEAFQTAHRDAAAIHASNTAALALLSRSEIAVLRGNAAAGRNFAELAEELANRSSLPLTTKVLLHARLGEADRARGRFKEAVGVLRRGLDMIAASGQHAGLPELALRFALVSSMAQLSETRKSAIVIGRETVTVCQSILGERDPNCAVALNMLSIALRENDDAAGALENRRRALVLMAASLPADSSRLALERLDIANDQIEVAEYAAARDELAQVLAQSEGNERLAEVRPEILYSLANATFAAGETADGLELAQRAREETLSRRGASPVAADCLLLVTEMELELGQLGRVAQHITQLETEFRASPDTSNSKLAGLRGIVASGLAIRQGRAVEAEAFARDALIQLAESHDLARQRVRILHALGRSLNAQRRWGEARVQLDAAAALASEVHVPAPMAAGIDISIAAAELGLGQRAGARQRAGIARGRLAGGDLESRREADAILR